MLDHLIDQIPTALLDCPQKRPRNWLADLRNDHFNSSLIHYLIFTLDNKSPATTLNEKKLLVNNNNDYNSLTVKDQLMCKMCKRSLYLMHREADSRIIFCLNSVANSAKVVIQT